MKYLLKIISCLFLLAVVYSCDESPTIKGDLSQFIPQNPDVVFKITNFETLQTDISNNSLLASVTATAPYTFFSEKSPLLSYLHPTSKSILCIKKSNDSTATYSFITKEDPALFNTDSIADLKIESLSYAGKTMQKITLGSQVAFTATKDSVFIASSSQKVLDDILSGKTEKSEAFQKVFEINPNADLAVILKTPAVTMADSTTVNVSSWTSLEVHLLPDSFTANGVMVAKDTVPQLLHVFKDQVPQPNELAKMVPSTATKAHSFTFSDAEKFKKHLAAFRGTDATPKSTGIFESINEAGVVEMKEGNALIFKSIDPSLTTDALAPFISENTMFRDITIYSFNAPHLFTATFYPLIPKTEANFIFQIDQFFVGTATIAAAEHIIGAYQNNDVIAETPAFKEAATGIGTSSSLLFLQLQEGIAPSVAPFFTAKAASDIEKISFKEYPLGILQLRYDRDFAHVALVCKKAGKAEQTAGSVSEKFNIKLEHPILGKPVFFNHSNTNDNAVAVQDVTNKLHLISSEGKILWTKKLEGAILGEIKEVDLARVGRKQLVFATKNKLYVLDKNGDNVAPFPLNFKDDITQPLSVFDYDNNRKYRFIVTQGKNILMYDAAGKQVKGFAFKNIKSPVVMPPQHIRMGNKDYITIAEENGILHIVSRVGKTRVPVSTTFKFSAMPIAEEDNHFVVITTDNKKVSVSQSGKVTTQNLKVSNSYHFTVNGTTKVTLDDNLLRINGILTELPFGVYTAPQIATLGRKTYITITETQEHRIYIFNNAAKIINGFPVYGTSAASLGEGNSQNSLAIAVKGEADKVIFYLAE